MTAAPEAISPAAESGATALSKLLPTNTESMSTINPVQTTIISGMIERISMLILHPHYKYY